MRLLLSAAVLIGSVATPVFAQDKAMADCRGDNVDRSLSGCSAILARKPPAASSLRAEAFHERGMAFINKGDNDLAIADLTDAIRLDAKKAASFEARGGAYFAQGQQDKAIDDYNEALRLDPKRVSAFVKRGVSFYRKGDYQRAIADTSDALRLDPSNRTALNTRGAAYNGKGDYDLALADLATAVRLDPTYPNARRHRGFALEKKGELAQALAAYEGALALNPNYKEAVEDRDRVRALIAKAAVSPTVASPTDTPPPVVNPPVVVAVTPRASDLPPLASSAQGGRRVALVIGNGAYKGMSNLPNPPNDARDMAASLQGLGFDVTLVIDGTRSEMEDQFARFAKVARSSDVALAFYAGHGLSYQNTNYLAPVDAKLTDEVDLRLRFIKVQDLIDDLQNAKGVRMLFLDACRDNEAAMQLAAALPKSRSASVSRGLARQEAEGVLIAYATQHHAVAQDGTDRNSPFTAALLKYLPTPGLEVRTMLTRVRADVLRATGGKQRPELSDSLDGEYAFR